MKRVLITMSLGVVGAILLAAIINFIILPPLFRSDRSEQAPVQLLRWPGFHLLSELTARLEDGPSEPEALSRELGYPVAVVPQAAEDLDGPEFMRLPTASGRHLYVGRAGEDELLVYAPRGAGDLLRIGPVTVPSGPPLWKVTVPIAVLILCAVLLSLLVSVPLARGLERLRRAARRISDGDLGARTATRSGPTRELSDAFNAMAERLEHLIGGQQQLLEAVAHELRTPSARIRFSLEMLEAARSDEDRQKRIVSIDADLTELDELVTELVTYNRVAADLDALERDALPLAETLEELVGYARDHRDGLDITLEAADPASSEATVLAERRTFRRALRNLLLNACRYGRQRVLLRYATTPTGVTIEVCDDGPGVDREDRERIFEPFTRADSSRSRESGGVGLGLAIVRRILEVHGATVEVDSCPELGGARFTTRWPAGA